MVYLHNSFEKCKVFFKNDNFIGNIMHKDFGVEVGVIDNFSVPAEYIEKKNDITNFSFHSVCDGASKYKKFMELEGKLVEINIVSEISGKIWKMRGYLSVCLQIKSNKEFIITMKNEDGKIRFNDIINYYETI